MSASAGTNGASAPKTNGQHYVAKKKNTAAKKVKRDTNSIKASLSPEKKHRAVARVNAGEKATDVAAELGVTASSIYLWRQGKGLARIGTKSAPATLPGKSAHATIAHADGPVRDAILYLRNARRAMMKALAAGKQKDLDESQLLTLLALRTLEST